MPTGNIVPDDYIDDPNRQAVDMQNAFNSAFDFLRALVNELDALSDPTIREAAVRDVGSAVGQVPDKAVLDARLGTSSNLGNMGHRNLFVSTGTPTGGADGDVWLQY